MAEIKPAEVSAILRQQLSGHKSNSRTSRGGYCSTSWRWYS